MKNLRVSLLGLFIASIALVACSGDDGADGPTGATGATGNANVKSTKYTVMATDWASGNAEIMVPEITKDIADNGSVAIFYTTDSLGTDTITWNPLPFTLGPVSVSGQGTYLVISYRIEIGKITLTSRSLNGFLVNLPNETNYNVVIIPSSSNLSGVNLDDYEEVKMVYGIKDNEL